jgi:hypothetical protein
MRTILREEILRVNCPGFGEQSLFSLDKARSLESYQVIIVNPVSLLHLFDDGSETIRRIEAAQVDGLSSYTLANQELLDKLNGQVDVRTEQLVHFLEGGGLLIYFLCRPFTIHGPTSSIDNYLWLLSLAPDQSAEKNSRNMSSVSQGRNVEPTEAAKDSEFFEYLKLGGLEWSTIIRTDNLTEGYTTLALAGPKKCIAADFYTGENGERIVFLPAPYSPDFDRTLIECANLWYQRKVGNDVTIEEVRDALKSTMTLKSTSTRLHSNDVEEARAKLIAKEAAQMDSSFLDGSPEKSSDKEIVKSSTSKPAAKQRSTIDQSNMTPSGPLPQLAGGAHIMLKVGSSSGDNGLNGSQSGQDADENVDDGAQSTEANSQEKGKGSGQLGTKAKSAQSKLLATSDITPAKEQLAEDLEALRSLTAAPRSNQSEKLVITADLEGGKPEGGRSLSETAPTLRSGSSSSKAELLLNELEQLNKSGEVPVIDWRNSASTLSKEPSTKGKASEKSPDLKPPAKTDDQPRSVESKPESKPTNAAEKVASAQKELTKEAVIATSDLAKPPASWASNHVIVGNAALRQERDTLISEAKSIEEKLRVLEDRLKIADEIKNVLLAGEGVQLTNACKKALELIGWTVQPSAFSESELWLNLGEKTEALARIVRSNDQGKRADIASLAESVITFWEEFDQEPKGVLVSCTWCNTPPAERTEPDYPKPGIEFAQKKNLCLLTTSQLLGIYLDIDAGKEVAEEIRTRIISANGVFDGFEINSVISPG